MVVSAPLGLDSGYGYVLHPTISSNIPSAIIRRETSTLVRLKSLTEHYISLVSFICVRRVFLVDDLSLQYMTNVRVVVGIANDFGDNNVKS